MKYSIITPAHIFNEERAKLFKLCIESINNLDYDHNDFEHIIVNDGSTYPFHIPSYSHINLINQPNLQRIAARNTGLKAATGDIILFLDADDEFEARTLKVVDAAFKKNPASKMVNFGCTFIHKDGVEVRRDPFKPKKKRKGHVIFGGGNIVNGTFVFKREVYEKVGGFPPSEIKNVDCTVLEYPQYKDQPKPYIRDLNTASPYDFSAAAQLEFPELQKLFMEKHPDHPTLLVRELGNPFGDDFYLFYKFTRQFHSMPVEDYLLRVHLK